jgi:FlaA1/EpsC-like NDP-sugar epimerase
MNLLLRILPLLILVKMTGFYLFDLYRGMWRYVSIGDLYRVIQASSIGSAALVLLVSFSQGLRGYSRSVFVIDWFLTLLFIAGNRLSIRLLLAGFGSNGYSVLEKIRGFLFKPGKGDGKIHLLIIGAGDNGEKICREILYNARLPYRVVGFLDDDPGKTGKEIHCIPVLGGVKDFSEIVKRMKIQEVLSTIVSSKSQQIRTIVSLCRDGGIKFRVLPDLGEIIDGKITVNAIRDVDYRDLIGRDVVRLEEDRIQGYLKGAKVLVTGAGGSIGSELCRQICRFGPNSITLVEQAESALYDIELELKKNFPGISIFPVLADVRDRRRVSDVFRDLKPHIVFHAAAYKHVPMMELHPWEAVSNNIVGTQNVAEAAAQHGVERFVLVSTDKAVRPTSVMGASKRIAEIVVAGMSRRTSPSTRFMTVRFGNVVGSVGSVVPLFKKQIENGGPVTVTHPEITRYFMTIPEACQLILQAGAMGEGGEIFILDMGTPVKIVDMARDLIRLSGFEPDVDIKIEFIGLRPGEKLYEELITDGEGIVSTGHQKIMVLRGQHQDPEAIHRHIQKLVRFAMERNEKAIRRSLRAIVPDFLTDTAADVVHLPSMRPVVIRLEEVA